MSDVYEPDENILDEFDKGFPLKEKQESQKEFKNAVSKIDNNHY